ncbi:MAG: hypothetical protein WDO16_11530 [Bacteroidota bacterium]
MASLLKNTRVKNITVNRTKVRDTWSGYGAMNQNWNMSGDNF